MDRILTASRIFSSFIGSLFISGMKRITGHLRHQSLVLNAISRPNRRLLLDCRSTSSIPWTQRWKSTDKNLSEIVVPIAVKVSHNPDDINIGKDLTGDPLSKENILKVLNNFYRRQPIRRLAEDNGLDSKLYMQAYSSFRKFCMESDILPIELHITISDIVKGSCHVDDLFPFFLNHARIVFPHIECIEELKKISDSRLPHNWYPEARSIERKIIFHAGPTNSGKTYNALKSFIESASGVYCGPLKLLAVEVNSKSNEAGTPCDLVTGEERKFAIDRDHPASHTACTVEMASTTNPVDVAVIDEIQMVRDNQRGWAWTRALLGIPAKEVHVCGEEAAVDIIKNMVMACGEEVEVKRYNRLTSLTIANEALHSLSNVRPGDAIVCFSKADIYNVVLQLERMGHEVAVIYGSLPPATKLAQAKRFNDPKDTCKILVATDAIGMGLNLSINRVIFYSVTKPYVNEQGERAVDVIPLHYALQIGGRAGRYGTAFHEGAVTTFRNEDLAILKDLFSQRVDPILAAGMHPTADQIEMFAYHLPDATLSNLIDIFVSLCQVDSSYYFMCQVEDFKFLADMIQHVPLPLRTRYVFCCAPINRNLVFVCTMFVKFARMYSQNEPITLDWLCRSINWPLDVPQKMSELVHLEQVFDVLDLYLWLSYRFPDLFPEQEQVRDMQKDLDKQIYDGVVNIASLIKRTQMEASASGVTDSSPSQSRASFGGSGISRSPTSNVENYTNTLTNKLVSSGVLTPSMIEKLKQEWIESEQLNKQSKTSSPTKSSKGSGPSKPRSKK